MGRLLDSCRRAVFWVLVGMGCFAGPVAAAVEFDGNRALSNLVLEAGLSERGVDGTTAAARLAETVLQVYATRGYLAARVDSVVVEDERTTVHLHEGERTVLKAVAIDGATVFPTAQLVDWLGLETGQPFSLAAFEAGVGRVLDAYENAGRPFAAIHPRPEVAAADLELKLELNEGPAIQVGQLLVRGNRVTRPAVVERLAGLRRGVPFRQVDAERARQRLLRSGLFATVAPIGLGQGVDRTAGVMVIEVTEARHNRAVGVVGYTGRGEGLTGIFDLELGNLAGTARRAAVRWEGRGRGVSSFDLAYREPWVAGAPVALELRLGRVIQDTLYTINSVEGVADYAVTPEWQVGVGFERQSTQQTLGSIQATRRDALKLTSTLDNRNSKVDPRRGWWVAVEGRLATKRLTARQGGAAPHVGLQTVEATVERAQPWSPAHVTFGRARGAHLASGEPVVPFYELYALGGATSLRGYREEQFRGTSIGLLTLEQRIVLRPDGTRIFGFTDLGWVSTARSEVATPEAPVSFMRLGYGAGLRLATRLGLVGVDYGVGEGDGLLNGKIHFVLDTAF